MYKNIILSALLFIFLGSTGCEDPYTKEVFNAYEEQPMGIYLETIPEYSEWVKLLKKADLYNALNINTKYTCFVVHNNAVTAYLQSKGWTSVDAMTENEASALMKYHVVMGADYACAALNGKISNRTASGDYLMATTDLENTDLRYINGCKIVRKDTKLINGYIHELEKVMDPIIYTVMEVIAQNPDYSIFKQALEEAGLADYLGRRDIILNDIKIRDYKTAIVVPNSVFQAEGINSLADLKTKYKGEPTDKKSDFYRYVAYHILTREYDYGDLTTYAEGNSGQNVPTLVNEEFITVSDHSGESYFNASEMGANGAQLIEDKYNIPACNGYVHEVNKLLELTDPIQFGLVWEPTEWDEFRTIEFYRAEKRKNIDPEEYYYFKEQQEHIRWKSIPSDACKIGYLSSDIDYDRFRYDDCLYASFDNVGYIEFDTPVIVRGSYKLDLVKWAWGTAGKFQMYIDGQKVGKEISMSGGTGGVFSTNIVLKTSKSHIIKFNVIDKGTFYLDRLIFTPTK